MDAGVPVPKPVAGVAMGLIKEGDKIAVLSDILGDEDHLGDMDFKVCGTADGVTAFQMDLKIGGVRRDIMESALSQAREGRLHILSKMAEALTEARPNFSKYAPRIFTLKVKQDKVREVIGSGGKVIRSIIERTGVKIDIEDDGTIHIASADEVSAQKAIDIINQIVEEPEAGKIYEGKITRIADFGAFVEIIPGTEGLCHISELEHFRVRHVEDVVKMGDVIQVKCLEVDPSGKIRLSRKALIAKEASPAPAPRPEGGEAGSGEVDEDRGNRIEARSDRGDRGRDREPRGDRDRGGDRDRFRGGDRDRDRDRGPRRDRDRGPDRGPDRGLRSSRDNRDRDFDRDRPRPDRDRDRGPERDRGNRYENKRSDRDDRGYAPREDRNPRREPDDRGFNPDFMDEDRGSRYGRDDED
jgi:polyribonucleotide nucleotidyltransferase